MSTIFRRIHLIHHIVETATLHLTGIIVSDHRATECSFWERLRGLPPEWVCVLAVCVVSTIPYAVSVSGEFVWDDRALVLEDTRFNEPDVLLQLVTRDFFGDTVEPFRYGYLRPLTSISYLLTWRVFGAEPLPFRLTNLALHTIVCLLVYGFARKLFFGDTTAAFLAAAIFAAHPVHVESVAWVAGRTDLLCVALVLPVLFIMRPGEPLPSLGTGFLAALACGFALSAKEAAIALPLAMVAFIPFVPPIRKRWMWLAAACVVSLGCVPYVVFRIFATDVGVREVPWSLPLATTVVRTFFATFARYVGQLIFPVTATPYMQNPWRESSLDPLVLAGAIIVVILLSAAWMLRRSNIGVSWMLILFLVSFAPVANVVRITGPDDMGAPMAQRFLYLPSLPWCVVVGFAAAWLLRRQRRRITRLAVYSAFVVVVGVYSLQTYRASRVWMTEKELFSTMVHQVPGAPLPRSLLGSWYHRHGQFEEAILEFEAALGNLPERRTGERWAVHNNLAGSWLALGRCDMAHRHLAVATAEGFPLASLVYNQGLYHLACGSVADAEDSFRQALEIDPSRLSARRQLASLLIAGNRSGEAIVYLEELLVREDRSVDLMVSLADAYGRNGQQERAQRLLFRASDLDPGNRAVEIPLGMLCLSRGKEDLASQAFDRVLAGNPRDVEALHGSAIVATRRHDYDIALGFLRRALSEHRDHIDSLLTMAQIQATLGDLDAARVFAKRAAEKDPDHPRVVSTSQMIERLYIGAASETD